MEADLPRASRKLGHGTKCRCGTCGTKGTWDKIKDGENFSFDDAVWYNAKDRNDDDGIGFIECHECWLK
jgi:hypothetical protein